MSLYSSGTYANTDGGKIVTNQQAELASEVEVRPDSQGDSWCYLFIHHTKVEVVSTELRHQFKVFVHKTIVYVRKSRKIKKEEHPSISGLLFIQGDSHKIQMFLNERFPNLHLVRDCSTGNTAIIKDKEMRPFIYMTQADSTRIRFMLHTIDYYAQGNPLIRITSGPLAGLEGYRIRISRDKCLVTSIGGMSVAIGGIHKESFENLDEYVKLRREALRESQQSSNAMLSPLQTDIDRCFYYPQNQLDVMAIANALTPWVAKVEDSFKHKLFDTAAEIALFTLEEIGIYFRSMYGEKSRRDYQAINSVCGELVRVMEKVVGSEDVSTDLKEVAQSCMESLSIRFPYLFSLKEFI